MRLKKLGAALVVVAALGAVLASSAFATATTTAEEWNVTGSATSTAVGNATFETEVAGTKYVLEGTGINCEGCKTENVGGVAVGSGALKFTGLTVKEPAGCSVASSVETTALRVEADYMEGEKVYVKFTPAAGETAEFATIAITGCSLATTLVPKGSVFVEAAKKTGEFATEQEVHSSGTINSTAGGSLKVGTKTATLTGSAKFKLESGEAFGVGAGGGGGSPLLVPGETYGGSNPAAPQLPQCMNADPVDCATGNLIEEQSDLELGGRGPSFHVTRTYNSQVAAGAKAAGPWGYGWSGPYSSHLEFNKESGAITVVEENGATVLYALVGEKYVPGAWVQATLAKQGTAYAFTLPDQETFKFNAEGKLLFIKERNGNAVEVEYLEGRMWLVTETKAERYLTFGYNGSGEVSEVSDPMGHTVKYAYESGNLVSVTLPGEEAPRWKFKYDASHQLTEMTDGRGGVTKTEYDEKHRVKKQTDPMERVTKWEYGESEGHKTTTITEPNGSTTFEKFDEAGEPLEVIQAKGTGLERKTTDEYSKANELVKSTDPLGHSTIYEYNAAGDMTLEKDPEGDETKWTYDATHDVETETTPKGEKTTYKRDAHGNVEVIEQPGPGETTQKWTFKHAANGDLESETDPLGHETKYEYDASGNVKAKIDPEGDKTTWTYNADGHQISEVSPRGNEEGAKAAEFETKTELDAQNRPVKLTDPLGHETKYAYDKNGNLESLTDPNGHVTKYTYDADNERTKVEAANGTTTETAYDSMGQVKSRTNGNGKTTKYERNALEELTETIDPLERRTTREYDKAGNLEKLKDPEGRVTTFTYDKADRLTKKSYSEAGTHAVEYEYDKDSSVVKMVDGTGTTKTAYDILERPTETEDGNNEVVKYEYDLADLPTKITYPNGKAVTREYDKADRLSKVTDWLSHSTTFSYNRDSQLKATTFPTAAADEDLSEYNRADQLSRQTFKEGAETLASLTYARNAAGQLESTTQTGLPGESPSYEYDKANRLIKGAGTPFEYDAAGNPKKIGTTELKYDLASELEKAGTTSYSFDKLGDRTKSSPEGGSATSYGWDQAGNLISVKRETPKIEDSYTYDGNGLRQSETISGATKHLAWDTAEPLPVLLYDGTNYYVYGPEGLPIEQIASETPTWLHHDQQGSTRLLTAQAGTVSGAYSFTPYGLTEGHTGTATSSLLYDGQYTSSDTGLIYLRARVYDPATAQFMSIDPVSFLTDEPYGYGAGDPVNRLDPAGLTSHVVCGEDLESGDPESDPTKKKKAAAAPSNGKVAPPSGSQVAGDVAQGAVNDAARYGNDPEEIINGAVAALSLSAAAAVLERTGHTGMAVLVQVAGAVHTLYQMRTWFGQYLEQMSKSVGSQVPNPNQISDLPMVE